MIEIFKIVQGKQVEYHLYNTTYMQGINIVTVNNTIKGVSYDNNGFDWYAMACKKQNATIQEIELTVFEHLFNLHLAQMPTVFKHLTCNHTVAKSDDLHKIREEHKITTL